MDTYLWLKALHIASIVTWIGGMLIMGVTYRFICPPGPLSEENMRLLRHVLKWDHRVTQPALLGAWVFGISLGYVGGWFSSPWLWIKLVFVTALSALHGMQAGRLRRYIADTGRTPPAVLVHSGAMTLAGMIAIVVLVVTKPF